MKFSIRPRKHKHYLQMDNKIKLDTIEEAIDDFRQGKFIIVVDDEDRENEGDLIIAAEKITPEDVNFMLKMPAACCAHRSPTNVAASSTPPHQVSDNTSMLGTPLHGDGR